MKTMSLMALDTVDHLVNPEEFHEITLSSPALTVFTDFKKHQPRVIEADTPAIQAEFLMRKAHVRLNIVVDKKGEMIGAISVRELTEQNFMTLQGNGYSREDILVRDMMLPRVELKALDFQQLVQATIGDVIGTLKQSRQLHCLVLDPNRHHIRGIISASDIAKRLHMPLQIERENTFIDIFKAVKP